VFKQPVAATRTRSVETMMARRLIKRTEGSWGKKGDDKGGGERKKSNEWVGEEVKRTTAVQHCIIQALEEINALG